MQKKEKMLTGRPPPPTPQVHCETPNEISHSHPASISAAREQQAEGGEGPGQQRDKRESGFQEPSMGAKKYITRQCLFLLKCAVPDRIDSLLFSSPF